MNLGLKIFLGILPVICIVIGVTIVIIIRIIQIRKEFSFAIEKAKKDYEEF